MLPFTLDQATIQVAISALLSAVCGLAGLAALGFMVMAVRGRGVGRSMQFAVALILLPFCVPSLCAALTVVSYSGQSAFMNSSKVTSGKVIGLAEDTHPDSGITYSAVVEFTLPEGRTLQFEDDSQTCSPPCHTVGDTVPVRYEPANPDRAIIDTPTNWVWTGVLLLLTLIVTVFALVASVRAYRSGHYWGPVGDVLDSIFS